MNYKVFISNSAWQDVKDFSSDVRRQLVSLQEDSFCFRTTHIRDRFSLPIDNCCFFDFSVANINYRVVYTVLEDKKEIVVVSVFLLRNNYHS